MNPRNYPVAGGRDHADPRFAGLATQVAEELTGRGYPVLTDDDWLSLREVLFGFLYGPGPAVSARARSGGAGEPGSTGDPVVGTAVRVGLADLGGRRTGEVTR